MSLIEAIILGIVQGLTEFLPISSTAHLRVVPALLGWKDPGAGFSAVIQCGTLAAVLIYFRRDIYQIGKAWFAETLRGECCRSHEAKMGWLIIIGAVPIVICGLLFQKWIKQELRSLYVIATTMIALALVLVLAEAVTRWRHRRARPDRGMDDVGLVDSIVVGCAQALALIPGASRSGTTISGGLFCGLSRDAAARFSFLLSLPAIFAAAAHELISERKELLASQANIINLVVCTLVSGIVGYAAIAFLLSYLRKHTTWLFIIYRLIAGGLILGLLWTGSLSPSDQPTDIAQQAALIARAAPENSDGGRELPP